MLNGEQLGKLNQIFQQEIVPVFEENPELVNSFMTKIQDYQRENKSKTVKLGKEKMDKWNPVQKKMYNDFFQTIKEGIIGLEVEPSDTLINWIMTRVPQNIVFLYENWGINDTEYREELYKIVRQALQMRGYLFIDDAKESEQIEIKARSQRSALSSTSIS